MNAGRKEIRRQVESRGGNRWVGNCVSSNIKYDFIQFMNTKYKSIKKNPDVSCDQ